MKSLKKTLRSIIRILFGAVKRSKPKRSASTPNVFIKELPDGVDTDNPPYRSSGVTTHRAPDGSILPEFAVTCHFKGGSTHTFTVWADDSASANWGVFFTLEELLPGKGHLLESTEVTLTKGTVQNGGSTSGAFCTLGDTDPLPPEFYN